MKKIILGLALMSSLSAFAVETCTVKDKRGFHPDGTPKVRIAVNCTDLGLQDEILSRYDSYRVGDSTLFYKEVKKEIVRDILAAGYVAVGNGKYQTNGDN